MRQLIRAILPTCLLLLAIACETVSGYELGNRWNRTATNGTSVGTQGSPITLTWSIADDGTLIPNAQNQSIISSNLISFLDTNFGEGEGGTDYSNRPWFPRFQDSFDRLGALSGLTFVYEPNDDGVAFADSTAARGLLGVRGDIRIGGKSYGSGSNTLASNYFPSYGEMMINTDQVSWYTHSNANYRRFRNVIMHEALHGLGVEHVLATSSSFLMEAAISGQFDGPQLDDLLALQRLYGDFYEKNGGNDTFNLATPLGTVTTTQSRQLGTLGGSTAIAATQTDFLSIDDDSDTDYFSFTVDSRLDVRLLLTPRGTTYNVGPENGSQSPFNSLTLSDLSLALYNTNGTSLLAQSTSNPAGVAEEITRQLLPGTYYARVTGAANNIQLYGIQASATTPLPVNLVWLGNVNNVWNTGITSNFKNGAVSSLFWDLDNVTFDDSSSVKTVNLAANVSVGQMQVNTNSSYVFTGSGGIVAGSVTIGGTGTVEFANSGNSYSGNTVINGGTLSITGNANAMKSLMVVNGGATLLMNPSDAGSMTSNFSIAANGVLQIGTASSTGNVFPDNPSSIVNNGTIRVFDEEVLRAVSGSGKIELEMETTTLQANPTFNGTVQVKSGSVARVVDNSGLGSASSITTVNSGGALLIDASPTVAAVLKVTGNGAGSGAVRIAASNNATFTGGLTLQGAQATLRADGGATGTFTGLANGSVDQTDLVLHSELSGNLRLNGGLSLAGGSLTKRGAGTGELRGAVNYSGDTSAEAGTLRLLGSGTFTGAIDVRQGAALEVGGTHQFASSVRLSGGGQIIGNLTMPGTIAPGNSAGTLAFANNLTLTSSSIVELEIGGTQAGLNFDLLQIVGAATLAGELQVSLIGGFMPQLGNEFQVLNAFGGLNGTTFGSTTLAPLDGGLVWNLSYGSTFVKLAVGMAEVIALPGDYNGDGVVNAADYVVWRDTLGSQTTLDADGDGNDIVDAGDYPVWSANFGSSEGAGASSLALSAMAAVPEPSALALIALTLAGMGLFRAKSWPQSEG